MIVVFFSKLAKSNTQKLLTSLSHFISKKQLATPPSSHITLPWKIRLIVIVIPTKDCN